MTTTSYKELMAQRAALEAKIKEARAAEVSGAVSKIRELVGEFGLSANDIFGSPKGKRGSSGPGAAKYRDPQSGKTWTGRGKPPLWIKDAADRDAFLIQG